MNIIDFFNSTTAFLPKRKPRDLNFYDFLSSKFKEYKDLVPNITSNDLVSTTLRNNINIIEELCNSISRTIELHFSGFPTDAFNVIDKFLINHNPIFSSLISSPDISKQLYHLYRFRTGSLHQFSKQEMFHIPFQLRHIVNKQRYSISGLPCLYLGGSAYICWEELNRPDFNQIHLARFRPADGVNIQVLDFGYRPELIAAMLDHYKEDIETNYQNFAIAIGVFWPLIFSCSIKVNYPEAPFKPEYLIPQYILQWIIKNSSCDGIRYFSCRLENYPSTVHEVSNFVFPSREFKQVGHCNRLTSKFILSEPLSWQLAKASGLHAASPVQNSFELYIAKDITQDYTATEFSEMEKTIDNLECAPL